MSSDLDVTIQELFNKYSHLSKDDAYSEIITACSSLSVADITYAQIGTRLLLNKLYETIPSTFSECTNLLREYLNPDYVKFVMDNSTFLNKVINKSRDDLFATPLAINTMINSYLMKNTFGVVVESPQYMYLRVAIYLCNQDLDKIQCVYDDLSLMYYTHATPTLVNANSRYSQCASCFLMHTPDTLEGITKSWANSAFISKNTGGIGCDFSSLRHSEISNKGTTRGILPWLKIQNEIMKTVDQAGTRKGSMTVFLDITHIDVWEFIEARQKDGAEDIRARELFYALNIRDEFMKRVENDEMWTLFCPKQSSEMQLKYNDDFLIEYLRYEQMFDNNLIRGKRIKARDLWKKILFTQITEGMPFILYIDSVNRKSNQSNVGPIRCSNLCMEIVEYVDENNIATCNLASINLPKYVRTQYDPRSQTDKPYFDFNLLKIKVKQIVRNLNIMINTNYYPENIPEIKHSNLMMRPLGIGVQGFADAVAMLDLCWIDENNSTTVEIKYFNELLFGSIYLYALEESCEIAKELGPYDKFDGSPLSCGKFQFDLWGEKCCKQLQNEYTALRSKIQQYGVRNSLLIALMPTASTASILSNTESFEPFNGLIYTRKVLSGQYIICNPHLYKDMNDRGLWTTENVKNVITAGGTLKKLDIDTHLKLKYKTVWEIPQKVTLELMLDRGKYVCQTQSFNLFLSNPNVNMLTAFHFAAWKGGAKTGMYYLRTEAAVDPDNFAMKNLQIVKKRKVVCTEEVCTMCSS